MKATYSGIIAFAWGGMIWAAFTADWSGLLGWFILQCFAGALRAALNE